MGREYTAHTSFISGVYYARTGNSQKAMNAFNTCIANDFTYVEAYMEKGFLLYDGKKITDALQVFRTLSAVKNTYPDAYYWIAKCYEAMNNKTEAVSNYQKALTFGSEIKRSSCGFEKGLVPDKFSRKKAGPISKISKYLCPCPL
jgi:tetratricopeptide (TPR) repeat protein